MGVRLWIYLLVYLFYEHIFLVPLECHVFDGKHGKHGTYMLCLFHKSFLPSDKQFASTLSFMELPITYFKLAWANFEM